MSLLTLEGLTARLGRADVLRGIDLTVAPGECVGLIGPNGAGKSTLMRAALGLVPHGGRSALAALPARERARRAAWLPQAREIAWPVSVEVLVSLGRTPHRAPGAPLSAADRDAIEAALARMDLAPFRDRAATELSGGEQARVLIARALAQAADLLLADEPTAGLDPAHELAAMETFAALAAEGKAVIVSLHDLGLAARWCTRLVLLDGGRIVADGLPGEVLTPARLAETYGITAHLAETDRGLVVQPLSRIA